jgi:hypothetical protein
MQGQRVTGAGLVGLGRYHPHVVAEFAGDLAQRVQTRGVDAVVVGEEDTHGLTISAGPAYAMCPFGARILHFPSTVIPAGAQRRAGTQPRTRAPSAELVRARRCRTRSPFNRLSAKRQ